MKWSFTLLVAFLFFFSPSIAQHVENAERYPDLFMTKTPKKSLVKIDLFNLLGNVGNRQLQGFITAGFERKLSTSLSIDARIGGKYSVTYAPQGAQKPFSLLRNSWVLTVGPRYYHNMARKLRTFQSANNLSGNYIAIYGSTQLLYFRQDPRIVDDKSVYLFKGFSLAPVYGIQQRIGKYFFFDFHLGFRFFDVDKANGIIIRTPDVDQFRIAPISRLQVGLAF